jgi:DNA polymerase
MRTLGIDIETFSSVDLLKSGVYKYAEGLDFEIVLFAFAFDNDIPTVVDLLSGERLPDEVMDALDDPIIKKVAHNANFERTCIAAHFLADCSAEQWECTMAKSSMLGLPLSLDAASKALGLTQEKTAAGKALIRYFSVPCKPTKTNGFRTRNLPEHDPEKWEQFKEYCRQDVVVEQAIRDKISFFNPTVSERRIWVLDQEINDRGIMLDPLLVKNAIQMDQESRIKLTAEAVAITELENPNSVSQLKTWLTEQTGESIGSLNKEIIPVLLKTITCDNVTRVLEIRQEMSKTSVKKYEAMASAVGKDLCVRGLLQYYGANRTGRWAGRLVQVQNLPQNHINDLDLARSVVKQGDLDLLEMLYGNVPDTLSQLVRTAFVPRPGNRLIVADLSAIEARIIAWLAGEKWRMDVFHTHGKIYEASASQMFRVPIEDVTEGSELRFKGKISELALGFGGSVGALERMGALKMGLKLSELPLLVSAWRAANKMIVKLWGDIEHATMQAVETGVSPYNKHGLKFYKEKGILFIQLPSGRKLSYLKPKIEFNKFGDNGITYEGVDQTTKQWSRQDTYGGKLVENIVQAIARDVLADGMVRLDDAGYPIVIHVHDEPVMDVPNGQGTLEEVKAIMSSPIPWAKGLPLAAKAFETDYYKKD